MFYTYLLQSNKDKRWYTGFTDDLRNRFSMHNKNAVTATKGRGPFKLLYYEACGNKNDALARERYLKSGPGKRYLRNRLKRFLSLTGLMAMLLLIPHYDVNAATFAKPTNFLTLNNGLVAWYTFDGKDMANGVARDSSGNGNNGSLTNISTSTFYAAGKIGQAARFDGVNDYVKVADTNALDMGTSNFSISFRNKRVSGTSVITKLDASLAGPGYSVTWISASVIRLIIDDGPTGVNPQFTISNANQWHHYVFSVNKSVATGISLYLDGVLQTCSGQCSYDLTTVGDISNALSLGMGTRSPESNGLFMGGSLDDVRVYNRALSAAEVLQLYNSGAEKFATSPRAGGAGLSSGLVGYWTFDGKDMANGVARDVSGNGNNGSLTNISTSTFYAPGKIGQAANFDGVNDYSTTSAAASINNLGPMTISAWIKPRTVGKNSLGHIMAKGSGSGAGGFGFNLDSGSTKRFDFTVDYDGATDLAVVTDAVTVTLGAWQHVVLTWDGTSNGSGVKIYKNGRSINIISNNNGAGSRISDSAIGLVIGNRNSFDRTFDGLIDDVRVYNRALSAQEIKQLYNSGAEKFAVSPRATSGKGLSTGLVGYWTFDGKDMANGVARDSSGNGNNGSLTNIATSTFYAAGKIGQAGRFDGVNDAVKAGTGANITGALTLSAWVKTVNASNHRVIVTRGETGGTPSTEQYHLAFSGDTNPRFSVSNGTTRLVSLGGTGSAPNGKWNHIVGTYNGTDTTRFYINGVQVDTDTTASFGSLNSAATGIGLGSWPSGACCWLNGSIDDVRIYNRALSSSEVLQLYNLGR